MAARRGSGRCDVDFDFQDLIDAVISHAQALGVFDAVNGYEPTSIPGTGMTCAVWAQEIAPDPAASGLSATAADADLNVRLYMALNPQAPDVIEPAMMNATSQLLAAYNGDFTLSGLVRNVGVLQAKAVAGYISQDGVTLRVITISLPVTINDLWTQSAVDDD
jgi:hypothetical protein